MIAKTYGVSFGEGNEKVLKLESGQHCKCTKRDWIACFKMVTCRLCEFHFN